MAHASARVPLRVHHACSLLQTGPCPDIRSSEAVLPKRPPRHHLSSSSRPIRTWLSSPTTRSRHGPASSLGSPSLGQVLPRKPLYKIGVHTDGAHCVGAVGR